MTAAKRKADEIADSEEDKEDEEADELGSNDDFGISNEDLFNETVLEEQRERMVGS